MGKLLFWVIAILVGLTVARITARAKAARERVDTKRQQAPPQAGRPRPMQTRGPAPAEHMVRCAHCGIHLPRSEALLISGQTWCSQDHALLGGNKG